MLQESLLGWCTTLFAICFIYNLSCVSSWKRLTWPHLHHWCPGADCKVITPAHLVKEYCTILIRPPSSSSSRNRIRPIIPSTAAQFSRDTSYSSCTQQSCQLPFLIRFTLWLQQRHHTHCAHSISVPSLNMPSRLTSSPSVTVGFKSAVEVQMSRSSMLTTRSSSSTTQRNHRATSTAAPHASMAYSNRDSSSTSSRCQPRVSLVRDPHDRHSRSTR